MKLGVASGYFRNSSVVGDDFFRRVRRDKGSSRLKRESGEEKRRAKCSAVFLASLLLCLRPRSPQPCLPSLRETRLKRRGVEASRTANGNDADIRRLASGGYEQVLDGCHPLQVLDRCHPQMEAHSRSPHGAGQRAQR